MQIISLINNISDLIISVSLIFFLYFVYREGGLIQKVHILERLFVRIALSIGASASMHDFLSESNRAAFLIHLSFAMIFSWGAYFHYKYIIKNEL